MRRREAARLPCLLRPSMNIADTLNHACKRIMLSPDRLQKSRHFISSHF